MGQEGHDIAAAALAADEVIAGTYRIVRQLGQGGMGEVFEAVHLRTGARLAIKVLLADFRKRAEVLARFQREAEVTSRLRHPNIVTVFDFDRLPDGRPFLVMELLNGVDLGSLLAAGRPLPAERVVNIVEQVALALAATHEAGVVHRDLSPGNIFIERLAGTDRDQVRVLDFGISKVRDASSALTHTKVIMGTPHYMSPEQALGHTKETDARADQFALAAIAYEMFTARRAFAGDDPGGDDPAPAVLYRVVHVNPPPLASSGVNLPAEVEQALLTGLAKDPAQRFPDILAFSGALAAAVGQRGAAAVTPSRDGESPVSDGGADASAPAANVGATWRLSQAAVPAPSDAEGAPAAVGATWRLSQAAVPAQTAPSVGTSTSGGSGAIVPAANVGATWRLSQAAVPAQPGPADDATSGRVQAMLPALSTTLRKATGEITSRPVPNRRQGGRRLLERPVIIGVASAVALTVGVVVWTVSPRGPAADHDTAPSSAARERGAATSAPSRVASPELPAPSPAGARRPAGAPLSATAADAGADATDAPVAIAAPPIEETTSPQDTKTTREATAAPPVSPPHSGAARVRRSSSHRRTRVPHNEDI